MSSPKINVHMKQIKSQNGTPGDFNLLIWRVHPECPQFEKMKGNVKFRRSKEFANLNHLPTFGRFPVEKR